MGILSWFTSSGDNDDEHPRRLKEARTVWQHIKDAENHVGDLLVDCMAVLADRKTPKIVDDVEAYMNRQVKTKQEILDDFRDHYPSIKERADKIAAAMSEAQATLEHITANKRIHGEAKTAADELLNAMKTFNDDQDRRLETLRFDLDPNGDFNTQKQILIDTGNNLRLPYKMVAQAKSFHDAVKGNIEESEGRTNDVFNDE
jgi:hypothetical protein